MAEIPLFSWFVAVVSLDACDSPDYFTNSHLVLPRSLRLTSKNLPDTPCHRQPLFQFLPPRPHFPSFFRFLNFVWTTSQPLAAKIRHLAN